MLGTFGKNAVEAHVDELWCQVVVIYKLGVANHLGCNSEAAAEYAASVGYLLCELLGVGERCQRVGKWLSNELYAPCIGEFLEHVEEFGHIVLELFEGDARDCDREAEAALVGLDHAKECLCGRDIAVVGYTGDDVVVGEIIKVVVVAADVEETVAFETERLMYLEVKTNCFHCQVRLVGRLETLSVTFYRPNTLLYMFITFWPALSQVIWATSARPSSRIWR